MKDVINTNSFNFEKAANAPGWLKELRGEHTPETEEYGISSFVYSSKKPFHPQRFRDLLKSPVLHGVIRSKGYFWLATRNEYAMMLHIAGKILEYSVAGYWFATIDTKELRKDEETWQALQKNWDEKYGDRRQELVFIGNNFDKNLLIQVLNEATLTDEEMAQGMEGWKDFEDPFPHYKLRENSDNDDEEVEENK